MYFANFLGFCVVTAIYCLFVAMLVWFWLGVAFPGMFDFYQSIALFMLVVTVRGIWNAGDTTQS